MTSFPIDLPALSRGLLDRSEDVRTPEAISAAWPTAKVLRVRQDGSFRIAEVASGAQLLYGDAAEQLGGEPPAGAVLVGSVAGTHYWAAPEVHDDVDAGVAAAASSARPCPADRGRLATIRAIGPLLSDDDAAIATTAVALLGWHARATFCSQCGHAMQPDLTGHSRRCPAGHIEFPRTDPAIIVLVHDGAGNVVLARQPTWDKGRYSVLAGFTEAGESLEGTVIREVGEEIGIAVRDVEYLGSQPWPFPRSLMIAFTATATPGAPLRPRVGEIEHAEWFSADHLRGVLLDPASSPGLTLPGGLSIARRMVEGFVRAQAG